MTRAAVVVDKVRLEEKLIVEKLREWSSVETVYANKGVFWLDEDAPEIVVIRPLSMYLASYMAGVYEARGSFTVNSSDTIRLAGDKMLAYSRLYRMGVPIPRTGLVGGDPGGMGLEGAAIVLKPPVGSWGRLVSRVRDPGEVRMHLELRRRLPCAVQRYTIVQEYIENGGSDYRCLVIDGVVPGCIRRRGGKNEWRSNVALGAMVEPVSDNGLLEVLVEESVRAAEALEGFFVSVDLLEPGDGGDPLVNEVNGVPEFKGFLRAFQGKVDPARLLADSLYRFSKR